MTAFVPSLSPSAFDILCLRFLSCLAWRSGLPDSGVPAGGMDRSGGRLQDGTVMMRGSLGALGRAAERLFVGSRGASGRCCSFAGLAS
ncbi:hypothetical protein B0J12DRAFT_643235 [Macrophomina phaseolina]|uniref:Secreted protein n=1 Tax=Macrophomina phaseolina TaxID=35725 RepID=A0ABQ8GSW2_9PEZI|nr:hypothetical protein B0J12DRAFT_643235 [Macrophomina phaseolina]